MMKLETYKSYVIAADETAFNDRCFIDEVETLKEAKRVCREYRANTIKVCVSCFIDNDTNKASEFGYGDTALEAKRDLKRLLNNLYGDCYTL